MKTEKNEAIDSDSILKITKGQVKSWEACRGGYAWFVEKFPQGGEYADVHQALLDDNRIDDASWLVGKVYETFWGTPELPRAEAAAGDRMIQSLNSMEMPTAESIISETDSDSESSGDWTQQASSGDGTKQASSGDGTKQASSGDGTQQASSGDGTQQASSGDWTKQASSGDGTKQASSGDGTKQASSGARTQQASSGDGTQQASSGDGTKHKATGSSPLIATSGAVASIEATGSKAIVASANSVERLVLGEGGCAAVPYNDGERTRFAVAYVGEGGIKAGVAYRVNSNGKFVEIEE
ncbi:hypothetical protein [Brenneria tiliae]|uniref:hypothetical protein n=1 Tax=Brenneria tiliae TaxID=2914984 RepID=UPI002014E026|nr:hypothetical protein [Brenneria tiliae]MCL2904753.1 hypothetical protein [Brenneria tiliae]